MGTMTQPKIIIIAGPNGAGKTTFAREFLPQEAGCPVFVNADLIAAGLSPFAPERAAMQAGRLTLAAIAQHVAKRESFAFETTFSGKAYATQIPVWRQLGYRVELFFLSLPTADIAVERVAQRVRQGGHDIPEATIRRRFEAAPFCSALPALGGSVDSLRQCGRRTATHQLERQTMTTPRQISEPLPSHGQVPADANADFIGSMAAIKRAAVRARQLAEQTGTDLIVMRSGKLVHVPPKEKLPS
jgi:predicted ABC-type ATPase